MGRLKPLEKKFKAGFFKTMEPLLKRGQEDFVPLDGNRLQRVLFLRPEKIGDMVISFPVFDGLISHFPHIKISIVGSPRNYAIIKDDPRFDRVYLYTKSFVRDPAELWRIRRSDYDCVVDMIGNDSVTALFLSQFLAPAKPRIGVGKKRFRDYYDFNYDHRLGNTGHIIDNTLKLLEAFGIDSDQVNRYAEPYIKPADWTRAERYLREVRDGDCPLTIGYNMSAGARSRIWPEEKSLAFVRQMIEDTPDCRVILITAPPERHRAEALRSKLDVPNVVLSPKGMSLTAVSALVGKLDLLISPDTSLVHIARAFRVPVIGFYCQYMKNFLLWRPYGQEVGAVVSGNDDNIFDITVDQALKVYREVLKQYRLVSA